METRPDYLAFGRPDFGDAEIEAVNRVLRSGWVGMGSETIAFEEELARSIGVPHVVSVNSCTSALFLSLLVEGVGPGDEVVCPSLTWCATANAALYLGATPVFCDIDPHTLCVTPESVAARLTPRTKAVMVVHFGGIAADVEAIRRILPPGVALVEDAAHALGATYPSGARVGTSGNLACFSFYANKNLSTGEGGAIALFDDARAARLRSLRQNALSADAWKRYSHPMTALVPGLTELGYKLNFTDLNASIGRVQLRRQPSFVARRLELATRYHQRLVAGGPRLECQQGLLDAGHARHLFVVMLPVERMSMSRDDFVLGLRARNIGASIHYAPLHPMALYDASPKAGLPCTDALSRRNLTLPIGPSMSCSDADYVADHVTEMMDAALAGAPSRAR
jgi:dTDP-4-amino-4,6-dideoxygalactose transaminase